MKSDVLVEYRPNPEAVAAYRALHARRERLERLVAEPCSVRQCSSSTVPGPGSRCSRQPTRVCGQGAAQSWAVTVGKHCRCSVTKSSPRTPNASASTVQGAPVRSKHGHPTEQQQAPAAGHEIDQPSLHAAVQVLAGRQHQYRVRTRIVALEPDRIELQTRNSADRLSARRSAAPRSRRRSAMIVDIVAGSGSSPGASRLTRRG